MRLATHLDLGIVLDGGTGLVEPPVMGEDDTGADQRLGAGPRLGKPALDEESVESLGRGRLGPPQARWLAVSSATSRPSACSAVATTWRALRPAVSY